ncbi:hypothetical protein LSH36_694g01074 [Paralvinella palmiformis]|uniref:Uncharacterized protein n=1 Tax=Paralvinella palmiformis TaxID=53620 RepID=A0AAD9J2P1_9ANNE|nr:hypothetical protein LSH36_694g01074 [Paralvinella palmiformis]
MSLNNHPFCPISAVDSVSVYIGVGVTGFILLFIGVIILCIELNRRKKKSASKVKASSTGPQLVSQYQTPSQVVQQVPYQIPQQVLPTTQYATPTIGSYNYYNGYNNGAINYGSGPSPWPQNTMWNRSPYGAAGASEGPSPNKLVPLYDVAKQNGSATKPIIPDLFSGESKGFILPKIKKPEPFILPSTRDEFQMPKDTLSGFILPTDKSAIIEEFGSDSFILPKPGGSSVEEVVTKPNNLHIGDGPLQVAQETYAPYASIPGGYLGPTEGLESPSHIYSSYDPYSSYQPYGPVIRPKPDQQELIKPIEPKEPTNVQQAYYYITENQLKPTDQQQQLTNAAKPANRPDIFYYTTAVDSAGASVPSSSSPSQPPVQTVPNADQPNADVASFVGYAVSQETSCVRDPEKPEKMTCSSTKNVYHLESSPDANKSDQLVWVAEQPQPQPPTPQVAAPAQPQVFVVQLPK